MLNDHNLNLLAQSLATALLERQAMVATAESCTGGWIAKILTDLAGSSAWFERGFVSYSNEAKQDLLGVSATTLRQHGAVSAETVAEMALGALQRSRAQYAVAVSGVAGPSGGSPEKPVGTVWLAWARPTQPGTPDGVSVRQQHCLFSGDRDQVRRATVAAALQGLLDDLAIRQVD
ncbi:MAG: nicotinamide-nucleotide amidase [Gammaproteobacteria bacterium]